MPKSKIAAKAVMEDKKPKKIMENKKSKMMKKESKTKMIKKTAPAEGGMKEQKDRKKNRNNPGTVSLREIRRY